MPSKKLTATQEADAKRLKTKFLAWQQARKERREPSSQEAATEALGFGQSALTQYLNGKIPLNFAAAAKFAALLGCRIEEFSPSLATQIADISSRASAVAHGEKPAVMAKGDLFHQPTEEDIDVFSDFLLLIGDDRQEVIDLIRRRAKQAKAYSAPVIERVQGGKVGTSANAKRRERAGSTVAITQRLRQRTLLNQDLDEDEHEHPR